ncbi:Os10g0126550 [Oryza sativa Japonica Group]|uniref:Os10g0126550 protein n=1 Tax=Oryza sativa subsp. japonica TaxID=39947 RepID=A0A0P0XR49_ORYSJ|nr:Os10g0126550 [Oryza sativa Japonica Group]
MRARKKPCRACSTDTSPATASRQPANDEVLSGDLDSTAHALANDQGGVILWTQLAGGLARPAPLGGHELEEQHAVLPPRFMPLPADLAAGGGDPEQARRRGPREGGVHLHGAA